MNIPRVGEKADVVDAGVEGVVAVLPSSVGRRLKPKFDRDESLIPIVLGFAEAGGSEDCEWQLQEAYRMGDERGQRLGALLRGLSADAPLDGC